MSLTVKVESAAFANALRRYHKSVNADTERFILNQAGMFVKDVVKYSYPKRRSDGVKAVRRDLYRAATPLSERGTRKIPPAFEDIRDQRLRARLNQLLRARNYSAIEEILNSFKGHRHDKVVPFERRLHEQARDNRGRVRRAKGIYTPDTREWLEYRTRKEKMVGLHKHGWVGAVNRLRALGIVVKLPKWVEKSRPARTGRANRINAGARMTFEMINPYGYPPGAASTMRFAMGKRANAINSGINRILKGKAVAAGFIPR